MNFYNTSVKEAESYFDDFPDAENKFVISSDYEIKKSNNKVLSMLIKYYKYSGGAHGTYEYIPYNVDLTSGGIFTLKDLFNENSNYKVVIENDAIVIFFDLYDIAPYVAGIPEFPINKEIISNLLNNQYKEIIFFKE